MATDLLKHLICGQATRIILLKQIYFMFPPFRRKPQPSLTLLSITPTIPHPVIYHPDML
jgi:hypothetical protein